jgi:hypothetical protein
MPIFNTAYDTLAGRGYALGPVIQVIQRAIVQTNFPDKNAQLNGVELGGGRNPMASIITTLTDAETSIPPLVFPIFVDIPGPSSRRSESYVLADVRPYLASNQLDTGNGLSVRQKDNYNFFSVLALLTATWMKPSKRAGFKFLGTAPMSVYSKLMANALENRFGLEPSETIRIQIIAAAFYSRLFDERNTIIDSEMVQVSKAIASATRAPSEMIWEVLEQLGEMRNIDDLVVNIKKVVDTPRLSNLNLGTLVVSLNSMWYGPFGRELIIAALEHPPTWVAILYAAFTDRTMNNSGVAKSAMNYKGSRGENDFCRTMKVLVANAKTEV